MIAAHQPIQRPPLAKLLYLNSSGMLTNTPRSSLLDLLNPGDLIVANDAATIPASLLGIHERTGRQIELRLAGRDSLSGAAISTFSAILFGEGDFRTPTEFRAAPPILVAGDSLVFKFMTGTIKSILGHPRFVLIEFDLTPDEFWSALAKSGRPIQYAHITESLNLWDMWTRIAGPPVAFEPPSAGFVIDWEFLTRLRERRVGFTTITHAAGISSTGDAELDAKLPFDEPYLISKQSAALIQETIKKGGRIIAVGTTVVRALEHCASKCGTVCAGTGLANQRIDRCTKLRVVDAIISGTHEKDSSHYQLLRAFADDDALERANIDLEAHGYKTHEFGDSVFIEKMKTAAVAMNC